MKLYNFLIDEYGYDEPIILENLSKELNNIKPTTIRQNLKRLTDKNDLKRYKEGIYFIPNPNNYSKYKTLSLEKVINRKYLQNRNGRIGYITGLAFANSLRLTTQNPMKIELVTNDEKAAIRTVDFKNRKFIIRKPKVKIDDNNYKVLQVLDLITNFDKLSIKPMNEAVNYLVDYLKDINITKEQLNKYLENYPSKTYRKLIETNLYDIIIQQGNGLVEDEITQK